MTNQELVQEPKRAKLSDRLLYAVSIFVIVAAALLLIFAFIDMMNNTRQQEALDTQTKKTNELVNEVKEQTEKNKKISQQAANYAHCNAVLLAQYTQTLTPIQIDDLNECVLSSFPETPVDEDSNIQANVSPSTPAQQRIEAPATNVQQLSPQIQQPVQTPTIPTNPVAPVVPTQPTQNNPNPLLSAGSGGLSLQLPCINALGLLAIACR